jgi:hypothetical protein
MIFPHPSTSPGSPSFISFIYIDNTHSFIKSSLSHITYSHIMAYIIMTLPKIQTQPTSYSIITSGSNLQSPPIVTITQYQQ